MKLLRILGALLLAAGVAAVAAERHGFGVETDFRALADWTRGGVLRELSNGLAGRGRVLVEGPAEADLAPVAAAVARALDVPPNPPFDETLRAFAARADGLLSPATRAKLLAGDTAAVAAEALARLYGPAPALVPVARDPFLLASDYLMSLQTQLAGGWSLRQGFPVRVAEGRAYWLVALPQASHIPPARLADFLARARRVNAGAGDFGAAPGTVKIWCGGAPFHAAGTATRAAREINLLAFFSLVAVLALGWRLFGTWRFVPDLVVTLLLATLAATTALWAFFPRPHALAFVFGTSLIGLAVDYYYHARAAGGAARVASPLAQALATSVASFLPLCLAAAPVLRQMAVFTVAGLVAAWAWVRFGWYVLAPVPAADAPAPDVSVPHRAWRGVAVAAGLVAAAGLVHFHPTAAPVAFYRPEAYLAASEAVFARLDGVGGGRYVYVKGRTLQEALAREEAAGLQGLSAIVPSLARQRANAALIAQLYAREGTSFAAQTGLPPPQPRATPALLDPEQCNEARLAGMLALLRVPGGLVATCPTDFTPPDDGAIVVLEPQRELTALLTAFTRETGRLFLWSLAIGLCALVLLFRRRAAAIAVPVGATLLATAGTLGWLRVPVTFFTLLCLFVLTGLACDYAIFRQAGGAAASRRAVRYSFLTSLAGLGALAGTDFAVTRAMGLTFAVGLVWAYFFAWAFAGRSDATAVPAPDLPWHAQREQSAGRWRLTLMWGVYRYLGKDMLKLACVPVMAFIYPFARPARRALASFYAVLAEYAARHPEDVPRAPACRPFSHLLGFAWSLADKTDACTCKKNLPAMTVREDAGARAFDACVAARRGAFLISTHLGTAEVLPALAAGRRGYIPHVHAFQQMGHDAHFTRMFMRHFDTSAVTLHAVESIGVETAVALEEALARGELVVMAGDRVSAGSRQTLTQDFLGRRCVWPKGVFALAKLLGAPVFFVTCLRTGWNSYTVHFAEGPDPARASREDLLASYAAFLAHETLEYPDQWYQFYDFFNV